MTDMEIGKFDDLNFNVDDMVDGIEGDQDLGKNQQNGQTQININELEKMLTQDGDYTLPFTTANQDIENEEIQQPSLTLPLLNPLECKCAGTELVINKTLPFEEQVGLCEACHDTPYRLEWGVKAPLHTVYKKNLTSDQGHPQIIVSKKSTAKQPFDHLVVVAELINTKDNSILEKELQGRTEESKIYHEIGETSKFEFKKLKIMLTSQQNKGANFQLLFRLIGQQNSNRFPLGCLISSPMQVYSHKNLLPENRHPPEIIDVIPDVLPPSGGKLCIICSNIQDSNFLKVKIGNTVISKIPRKNAPVNATGIKVHQSTLVVDVPEHSPQEKLYVTVSNKDDKWSKEKKNFTVSFRELTSGGISSGPSLSILLKTLEDATRSLYNSNLSNVNNDEFENEEDNDNNEVDVDENIFDDADDNDIQPMEIETEKRKAVEQVIKTENVEDSAEAKRLRKLERQERRQRKLERQIERNLEDGDNNNSPIKKIKRC